MTKARTTFLAGKSGPQVTRPEGWPEGAAARFLKARPAAARAGRDKRRPGRARWRDPVPVVDEAGRRSSRRTPQPKDEDAGIVWSPTALA